MEQTVQGESSDPPVDIKRYFYLFKAWAWLIVLSGLVAGTTAYIVSIRMTPVYEASTRLLISAPSTIGGVDPSALVTTQMMTSTYSEMLLDRPVLEGVIDQLALHITPEVLKESISVEVVMNTQLLVVTVENTNPALAADIANAMAAVFTDRIRQLQTSRFAASRDGLAKQVTDMEELIKETDIQIARTSNPQTLLQLETRLTQYRTIYSSLVTSYEQVRLAEEQTSTNVVVSEPANVPTIPVRPRTILNTLLSVLMAVMVAVGAVLAFEVLDDTIKDPEEIQRQFDLPVLGVIDSQAASEDQPITMAKPYSQTSEAFRSLRTNVIFSRVDAPLRRILITSATPQEGKTTIASNLAVVFAQGEKKTLLIDADLRRPSMQLQFGLPNRIGLTDLFHHPLDSLSDVTQRAKVHELTVMTSGVLPPNPTELLTSKTMALILDKLNRVFDLIVIDTPPILTVSDAAALAPAMDGVILVVKPGRTKVRDFRQALRQLQVVGARVLGVVLNEVDPASRNYGYYYNIYYSNNSDYYRGDGIKPKRTNGKNKQAPERVA